MPELHSSPRTHIQQVDYIRAVASCAVALFHLGGKALPGLKYGWLGVQMFFLLSGFVICWAIPTSYSWRLMGKFIGKRLIRIEPPYLVSLLLAIAAHFVWLKQYQPDWLDLLGHLAYVNNFTGKPYLNPVYWTLGIEFQYYVFIAVCFPFLVKKWGVWLLLVLCLLPVFWPVPIKGTTLLNVFPLFALGILYYLYLKEIKGIKAVLFFGVLVAAISVYTSGWLMTSAGLLALAILVLPLKTNAVVGFLSKISFSLYLTHDIIGSSLVVFMSSHLPRNIAYKALSFATGITVSLLFAFVFYKLMEAPCLRLSKRIRYPHQYVVKAGDISGVIH
jgi:peptidoglycan/LPS O-acetylase OafA/YrhL